MADAAAQKREARRRRILENSENRLKRITGLYSSAGNKETEANEENVLDDKLYTIPSVTSFKSSVEEPEITNNVESFMESPPAPENVPVTDDSLWKQTSSENQSLFNLPGSALTSQTSSVSHILCWKARTHIISLAVIVRILFMLPCAGLFGESALVPLCTVELIEWINTKLQNTEDQDTPSGLLGMALLLCGVAPKKATRLLVILDTFSRLTQDFCIYFFVFFITHAFLQTYS